MAADGGSLASQRPQDLDEEWDGQGLPGIFASLFLSRLADQILLFIVPLLVFQSTNSASWAGLAFFAEALPRFLAFPVCGALCDRFSPVRILHLSQACRAITCILAVVGHGLFGGIYWLVVLSALCGVLTTQGIMAREVLLPHVFARYSYLKDAVLLADRRPEWPGARPIAGGPDAWDHELVLGGIGRRRPVPAGRPGDVGLAAQQHRHTAHFRAAARALAETPARGARAHPEPGRVAKIICLAVGVNLIVGVTLATSAALVVGVHEQGKDYYAGLQAVGAG